MPAPTQAEPERSDRIDLALVEAMERMAQGDPGALESVCLAYPEIAGEIRDRFGALRDMNLLPTDAQAMAFPERLGDFRLVRRLGGGGMGVVYEAVQEPLGRTVALKLIRPEHLYFPRARERFRRETEAVARLSHPGIVAIHTVGEANNTPFFAMELVHGASLAYALEQIGSSAPENLTGADLRAIAMAATSDPLRDVGEELPPLFAGSWVDTSVRIAIELAAAVSHAHGRGILHRDIKPSNVVVTAAGRVVLLDFGLAGLESELRMTMSGSTLGSMLYMAPEQVIGRVAEVDARTDVYALGVTLYELLALQVPFDGANPEQARTAILEGRPSSIRARNPEVSRDLETVCMKAIEHDRSRRYATIDELAADLRRVLEGHPILARPPGAAYRGWRWVRRNPTVSTAIALGGLFVLAVPSALYVQQRAHNGELRDALQAAITAGEQAGRASERANLEAREADVVARYLVGIFGSADPYEGGRRNITARELLRSGFENAKVELADQPEVQARLLERIGESYSNIDSYEESIAPLERAVELRTKLHGDDDVRTARTKIQLASALRLAAKPGVVPLLRNALKVVERDAPAALDEIWQTRVLLALSLIDDGEYDEPLTILREAAASTDSFAPFERSLRWSVTAMIATGLQRLDDPVDAESVARRTLASESEVSIQPHPWRMAMLSTLARAQRDEGHLGDALATYETLLSEVSNVYEADNPNRRVFESEAALARMDRGDLDEVADTVRTTYESLDRNLGIAHAKTVAALINLAHVEMVLGRADEGIDLLESGLASLTSEVGASDPRVGLLVERIGILRSSLGDLEGAEQALRRARPIASADRRPVIDLAMATMLVRVPERRNEACRLAEPYTEIHRIAYSTAARYVLARCALEDHRLDDAERIAREALARAGADSGAAGAASGCRLVLAAVRQERGESAGVRDEVEAALADMARAFGPKHAAVTEARARFAH